MRRSRIEALVADARGTVAASPVDSVWLAWFAAQIQCELALADWTDAQGRKARVTAHAVYQAALDREEAAARDLELRFAELDRLARPVMGGKP